jgi:hypothetical protein
VTKEARCSRINQRKEEEAQEGILNDLNDHFIKMLIKKKGRREEEEEQQGRQQGRW